MVFVERLKDEDIKAILDKYGLQPETISQLVPFCQGLPRAAVLLAENLLVNPGDPFGTDGTPWRRFLYGRTTFSDPVVGKYETILLFLAMFRKFGAQEQYAAELDYIRELCNRFYDSDITARNFSDAIRFFKDRKLLQGQATYYISPKVLHLWLWKTWWNQNGQSFKVHEFINELKGALRKYFFEMFEYAGTSSIAQDVARRLLAEGGPLHQSFLESEVYSEFFLTLTKVAPAEAQHLLELTVGQKKKDELIAFEKGRRNVVWALEWLAQWTQHFIRASNLLIKLAGAENESISNNASGVFTSLFSGYDKLGHTEAPPELRISLLTQLLASGDPDRRGIAYAAIDIGLKSHHLTKMITFPESPFEKQPNFWAPKTRKELWEYYKALWNLNLDEYDRASQSERERIVHIACHHLRALLWLPDVSDYIFTSLKQLYEKHADKHIILKAVADVVKYDADRVPQEVYEQVNQFLNQETEASFAAKFERYVIHGIDSEKFEKDASLYDRIIENAAALASYANDHPSEFEPIIGKLFDEKAMQGNEFGRALGNLDVVNFWYPKIVQILHQGPKPNLSFCVAYLAQRLRNNGVRWEQIIKDVSEAKHLSIVVMISTIVGVPDFVADVIIEGLKTKNIPLHVLEYFRWGKSIQFVPQDKFFQLMDFLLSEDASDSGPLFCISLTASYFLDEKRKETPPPKEFLLKVLTHPVTGTQNINLFDFDWERLTKYLLKAYPESAPAFTDFFFAKFGERGTFFDKHSHYTESIAHELLKRFPLESWSIIRNQIEPPLDSRQYHLLSWLHGHMQDNQDSNGALIDIPEEELFSWIDENKEPRAQLIAHFVPAGFGDRHWSLIRKILIQYGSIEEVGMNLRRCFTSEGWTGPFSLHYKKKLDFLEKKLEGETEPSVITWVQSFCDNLKAAIEDAKMKEERSRFGFGFGFEGE